MKKYILYIIIPLMVSCSNLLDMQSDGRTSLDEIFSERNGIRGYLNSCYGYCPAPYMDRASMTDEAQDADDITAGSKFSMWYADNVNAQNYASYSSDGSPWTSLYQGIRKCNVFLDRIRNVGAATIGVSGNEIANWTAQVHTLRALYYLQLAKRYGDIPVLTASYEIGHDYSSDKREPFSKVVKLIMEDCDAALSASDAAFGWGVPSNSFGIMTRAIPYAIKSQAITYAASPQWSDGTYTWADATAVNKEALGALLANNYQLFDVDPPAEIAQNPYALYFITNSDDQRSVDKETIYQCGTKMEIWRNAGLPSTAGMLKSGPCPTQELVDSYEMQATGQIPITGYSDELHLVPIINSISGYNPANPYEGRDPRFYASIYYNEAQRTLGASVGGRNDSYPMSFNLAAVNDLSGGYNEAEQCYNIETIGGDPYIYFDPLDLQINWAMENKITFTFEYRTNDNTFLDAGMYFVVNGGIDPSKHFAIGDIPASSGWTTFTVDLSEHLKNNYSDSWNAGSYIRFDLMEQQPASRMDIRNFRMNIEIEGEAIESTPVYTYVGAPDGISVNDRRSTRTGYYMRKFNNWQSNNSNNADGAIRLFRLAEVYLNFAESAYQSDGPDTPINLGNGITMSARDAVNAVRKRAQMPDFPVGMSVNDFEKKYRNERRVELAFEEHRYFDVRRWKILEKTDRYLTGMRITKDGNAYTYTRISFPRNSWKDKYMLYAIDQDEVNKMLEFTGSNWQNTGWN